MQSKCDIFVFVVCSSYSVFNLFTCSVRGIKEVLLLLLLLLEYEFQYIKQFKTENFGVTNRNNMMKRTLKYCEILKIIPQILQYITKNNVDPVAQTV